MNERFITENPSARSESRSGDARLIHVSSCIIMTSDPPARRVDSALNDDGLGPYPIGEWIGRRRS